MKSNPPTRIELLRKELAKAQSDRDRAWRLYQVAKDPAEVRRQTNAVYAASNRMLQIRKQLPPDAR